MIVPQKFIGNYIIKTFGNDFRIKYIRNYFFYKNTLGIISQQKFIKIIS